MELEIRSYHSSDIDNVWDWQPTSTGEIFYQLSIDIGERGQKGSYTFQVEVATPDGLKWFAEKYKCPISDRALLIFIDYDWQAVVQRLNGIVEHCSRDNWAESIACLQRYFLWEYEDLRVFKEDGNGSATS